MTARTLYRISTRSTCGQTMYPQIAQDGRIVRWHPCRTDAEAYPRQQAEEMAQNLGDWMTHYSTAAAKEALTIRLTPLTGGGAAGWRYRPATVAR